MGGGGVKSLTTRKGEIVRQEEGKRFTARRRVEDERHKGWKGMVRPYALKQVLTAECLRQGKK